MSQARRTLPAMRAGIYTRISDDRRGDEAGVTRQQETCEALCHARGWDIVASWCDNDISAYRTKRRPGYDAMIGAAKNGDYDVLVAWHPDRFTRSPRQLEDFIDAIEAAGVEIATVAAGTYDLTNATGKMAARIVGAVARQESELKSERIRAAQLRAAKRGDPPKGGHRPYGYTIDRLILEDEAAEIRTAAAAVLAGASLRSITADWHRRHITLVSGKQITISSLRRLLMSPAVGGWRQHQKRILTRGNWQPILDADTWNAVQSILGDPARLTRKTARRYLLTGGIARCGVCEGPLHARPRGDKRRSYVCASGTGFDGCGKIRRLADPLETEVAAQVVHVLGTAEFARRVAEREHDVDDDDTATRIAELETESEQLARDHYVAKLISRAQFLAASQSLDLQLQALRRTLLKQRQEQIVVAIAGPDAANEWEALDFDRRRAVLRQVLDAVTVLPALKGRNYFDPDRIELVWRL